MKKCSKCGEMINKSEFCKKTASPDGLNVWCKNCDSGYKKAYYIKNAKKIKIRSLNNFFARAGSQRLKGVLNFNCNLSWAVITEYIVCQVLSDCENCNKRSFISPIDLISEKHGTINVKSSKLSTDKHGRRWSFMKIRNLEVPDYYICIGFNEIKTFIQHVWFIPGDIIDNSPAIRVSRNKLASSRYSQFEVDSTPYNDIYKNLDLATLDEFRNSK